MKGLHVSDIHGDVQALRTVVDFAKRRKDLEAIICTGDILGQCLGYGQAEAMHKALQFMADSIKSKREVSISANNLIDFVRNSNAPEKVREAERRYTEAETVFDTVAKLKYEELAETFRQFPQPQITIPGNWDSSAYFEHFEDFDVHRKRAEVNGVSFAGYGSAYQVPIMIPPTRTIPCSGSELISVLISEDPNIALTHVPPFGLNDVNSTGQEQRQETAERTLTLAYMFKERPALILSGHDHLAAGETTFNDTKIPVTAINAGNLGQYLDSKRKGTFVEFEFDGEKVILVKPYRIVDGKITEIQVNPAYQSIQTTSQSMP